MSRAIVVASHRRSGTHLTIDTLRANARDVRSEYLNLDQVEPSHPKHLSIGNFDRQLRAASGTVLVKTHALPGAEAWRDPAARAYALELLADAPTIYVHRDGRDVLVSLYHYLASFLPAVRGMTFAEFIRSPHTGRDVRGVSRAAYWQHHVLAWLDRGPSAVAGYEALLGDFDAALPAIADRAGLRLRARIRTVTLEDRRARQAGLVARFRRRLGLEGRSHSSAIRPRAGRTGAWGESFSASDLAWFQSQASDAMRRLGYD